MDINQACEAFRVLLEEQQARIANMDTNKTDFATKAVVTIGIVDGDGIGTHRNMTGSTFIRNKNAFFSFITER